MTIILQGTKLNQRQLDAMTPVMNQLIQGRITQDGFEEACVQALQAAGCPPGYDTTMPSQDQPVMIRANAWIVDGDVGASSRAIWSHMMGTPCHEMPAPRDLDDLNRCLLLLDLIPEWSPRMLEMARYPEWKSLAGRWGVIAAAFLEEAGLNWSKDRPAPRTNDLFRQARGE